MLLRAVVLKADALGKSISVPDVSEAGCLGAAMLARAADADELLTDIAAKWVKAAFVQESRREFADYYARQFESYKQSIRPYAS